MAAVFAGPKHMSGEQLVFGEAKEAFAKLEEELGAEVLVDETWVVEEWEPESAVVRYWTAVWETDPAAGRVLGWRTEGWN